MRLAYLTQHIPHQRTEVDQGESDGRSSNDRIERARSAEGIQSIGSLPCRLSQPIRLMNRRKLIFKLVIHAAATVVQVSESDELVEHDKFRFRNAEIDRGE